MPSDRRHAFVRDASDGDEMIHSELLSLIQSYDASEGFFEKLSEDVIVRALATGEEDRTDETLLHELKGSRYQNLEQIGRGGMGVVYKAHDTQLGRPVALKFLPRHHALNPEARGRLIAEARAASRLDHPNIGVVYEIGETEDGRQFIAMTWYDGETLKERIRRGPIPCVEAVAVAVQLSDALAAAHRDGIIHRDVKPANVMLTRSGGVKLVDFGIAKLTTEDDGARPGLAGTVAYMSPEQTQQQALDARTDIWSIGVVLHEMLTGGRPFSGKSDEQMVSSILSEKPRSVESLAPGCPPAVSSVVARCLEKDRKDRFQTASEFCEALKKTQRPTSSFVRYRKVAGVAALPVLAISAFFLSQYPGSTDPDRTAMLAPVQSIAVLPFRLALPTDSTSCLCDAIAEDLRSDLGRIRPITVPSYLSSISYSAGAKPATQIAKELGANYVITGDVRTSPTGITIDLSLLDGGTGVSKFSRRYTNARAGADIVREATRDVIATLGIPVSREHAARLSGSRTTNRKAYDLYLQGLSAELTGIPRTAFGMVAPGSIRAAQGFYTQARTLDPLFASARAGLASSHMASAKAYDTTRARLDQARIEAEAALRMDPQLSDTYASLSGYWNELGDAGKAIEAVTRGLSSAPNNVKLHIELAQLYLATGRREDGVTQFERALQLDPRQPIAASHIATAYARLNRNGDALKAFSRYLKIVPNDNEVRLIKGHFFLKWKGTPDTLIAELRRIPPEWDDRGMATFAWYVALRMQRKYKDGLAMLAQSRSQLSRDGLVYYPTALMQADMLYGLGDMRKAKVYYERARAGLAASAAKSPHDPSVRGALALSEAGLGRRTEAIADAAGAIDLARGARNRLGASGPMGTAVEVYARVGDLDRAFQTLELLFAMPAGREASVHHLQTWPGFDPLRTDARFNELLQRFTVK